MKRLKPAEMLVMGAGSRNCGNTWQTYWITTTCGVAGGLIGLAGGGIASSAGSVLGKAVCTWFCHYAS